IEKIVQTAKQAVKATVLVQSARAAPGDDAGRLVTGTRPMGRRRSRSLCSYRADLPPVLPTDRSVTISGRFCSGSRSIAATFANRPATVAGGRSMENAHREREPRAASPGMLQQGQSTNGGSFMALYHASSGEVVDLGSLRSELANASTRALVKTDSFE